MTLWEDSRVVNSTGFKLIQAWYKHCTHFGSDPQNNQQRKSMLQLRTEAGDSRDTFTQSLLG